VHKYPEDACIKDVRKVLGYMYHLERTREQVNWDCEQFKQAFCEVLKGKGKEFSTDSMPYM